MPIRSLELLDKMTVSLFSLAIGFLFCGLFLVPAGSSYFSNIIVIASLSGVLNYYIGGKRDVGLRDKRLLWIFFIYALVILVNRQVHGDQSWLMRNLFYIIVFSLFIPRRLILLDVGIASVILGGVSIGGLSLWQYHNGLDRIEGYTNAILFSQAALVLLILNLNALYSSSNVILLRVMSSFAIIGTLYTLYQSQSRGVWVAVVIVIGFVLFYEFRKKPIRLSLLTLGLIMVLGFLYQNSTMVQQRVADAASDLDKAQANSFDTSWGLRLMAWKSAWFGFVENPILGVGYNGIEKIKREQLNMGIVDQFYVDYGIYHAHNQVMQNLLVRGVFGGVIAIAMLFYPILLAGRKMGWTTAAALIPLGISICSLSDVPLEHQNTLYLYTLSIIYCWLFFEIKQMPINKND
ncbi:O-antigen ligase family protein [Aeromonas hydrophila]|uniref:O-antigen ligase family protein n=1 Tax=Aeromonas hydrophila TaxID=644 RepID=UPI003018F94D